MLADRRLNAVALGPGLGVSANTRNLVMAALDGERAVLLDADALTSFAYAPDTLFAAIFSFIFLNIVPQFLSASLTGSGIWRELLTALMDTSKTLIR